MSSHPNALGRYRSITMDVPPTTATTTPTTLADVPPLSASVASLASSFDAAAASSTRPSNHRSGSRSPILEKERPALSISVASLASSFDAAALANTPTLSPITSAGYFNLPDESTDTESTTMTPSLPTPPGSSLNTCSTISSSSDNTDNNHSSSNNSHGISLTPPRGLEQLTSIPLLRWSCGDVTEFIRLTLHLPLELARDMGHLVDRQKINGLELARMSELDLRCAGVNSRWCQRIVQAVEVMKERQHRIRLVTQEDSVLSSAAYIEEQFVQQGNLLKCLAEQQKQLMGMVGQRQWQQKGWWTYRMEQAESAKESELIPSAVTQHGWDNSKGAAATLIGETETKKKAQTGLFKNQFDKSRHWARSLSTHPQPPLALISEGFAIGVAVTMLAMHYLR